MNKQAKPINKTSATELRYENGAHILRSYRTAVAAYIPALGWLETTTKYSVTTSKHISQWKKRNDYPLVAQVPQAEIDNWEQKLDGLKMGA